MFVTHLFEPVFNEESRILILGTMPSQNPGSWAFIMVIPGTGSGL